MGATLESRHVSNPTTGLFHCGRCGIFFKAKIGPGVIRRCPECDGDPTLALDDRRVRKLKADATVVRDLAANPDAAGKADDESRQGKQHAHQHRRKINPTLRRLVIFVGLWLVVLGVIAAAVMIRNKRRDREGAQRTARYKAERTSESDPFSRVLNPADREFIKTAYPDCQESLFGFLQSVSPEMRSHWVCDPLNTIGAMTGFGDANPSYPPDEMPEQEVFTILNTPDGRMVESLWKAPDGRNIEAVFQHTDDGWRLDWEEFVRYSQSPWVMFLVGEGEQVAEFRLLARERLAEERKNKPLSIVFHPPHFGEPSGAGPASPVFTVLRASKPGRKLEALFALAASGKTPFDAGVPSLDPTGMIRVRVRVRRSGPTGTHGVGRTFRLEDVLAGHWLRIRADGIPDEENGDASPPTDDPPAKAGDGSTD